MEHLRATNRVRICVFQILIDNKQHYKVFGKPVDLTSLIRIQVEDGKVVRHEDWWNKKSLKNRRTVGLPLAGSHAAHPRPHGIRQGPTNHHHPLLICLLLLLHQ
ncbi:hypothetical protein PVAP13_9NG577400 [Panicum virgatum]|uniref:Uncharacterized protein n=1 Tax=Panicum virgatum TaxID=38727 RepID=A0A8T0MNT7_PANVG|nr:hypothetical protein PVAP13_9NG577400 [Panicum virgatum]